MEYITSRANPLLARIRKLTASRAFREAEGEYVGDSPKLLAEALRSHAPPRTVVCTRGTELPPLPAGVRVVEVPADVMASVSPMKTPQGTLFIGAAPSTAPPPVLAGRRYLALEGVQDPGNVGTILRCADAFEADGVFLLEQCADPFSHKTLRASMGAAFRCPVWQCGLEAFQALAAAARVPLWGAALGADASDPRGLDWSRAAVLLGSEGRGLSKAALAACKGTVRIPMNPRCESLNVAAAAAVLLWEGFRGGGRESEA